MKLKPALIAEDGSSNEVQETGSIKTDRARSKCEPSANPVPAAVETRVDSARFSCRLR